MSERGPMDLLEDALIDVEGTAATLDAIVTHLDEDDGRTRAVDVLTRHLQRDVEALREAFRACGPVART